MSAPTGNWNVYGHDWAVDHLRKSIAHGRVRHAYLFVGAESVGKETLARAFAMTLNCTNPKTQPCGDASGACSSCRRILSGNHPDVLYPERESETSPLKIEEIRTAIQRLALKPFEARYRIAIFRDFDTAQPRAQDALLKTLEEPAPHAILMLLARSLEAILPTIASRSQVIHLRPAPATAVEQVLTTSLGVDEPEAALLARASGGRIGWALRALHDPDLMAQRDQALNLLEEALNMNRARRFDLANDLAKDKAALLTLLELWQTYWRDALLLAEHAGIEPTNIDRIDALENLAARYPPTIMLAALNATRGTLQTLMTNANTRLALEVMFLDYPSA
jgi:DNA polymerase-3 subunit delta'